MIIKSITDRRQILGLLREVEKHARPIVIEGQEHTAQLTLLVDGLKLNASFQLRLTCESELPSEAQISFWLEQGFFKCSISGGKGNTFDAPAELQSIERRTAERIQAGDLDKEVVAVLSLQREKLFGELRDLSGSHIAIATGSDLPKGPSGQGRLSLLQGGKLIGDHYIIVDSESNDGGTILMRIQALPERLKRASHRGSKIEGVALNLCWPDENGFSSLMKITEISGLGMSGSCQGGAIELLPVGTIFYEKSTEARIRLAWKKDEMVGFSFDTTEPGLREKIIETIRVYSQQEEHLSLRKRSKRNLHILTKSGLVKGSRALSYSNASKAELFYQRANYSSRWFYKIESESHFLSFLRVSDEGWLIQELASSGAKGSGEALLLAGIHDYIKNMHEEPSAHSAIIGIYDLSSPFNQYMWREKIPPLFPGCVTYKHVLLGQIKGCRLQDRRQSPYACELSSSRDWFHKRAITPIDPVLNAFGVSFQAIHPGILSNILRSEDLKLDREVFTISHPQLGICAIAVKLGLPPVSNVTSLAENMYIFHIAGDPGDYLHSLLFQGNPALTGVEDICIVSNSSLSDLALDHVIHGFAGRPFELALLPIHAYDPGEEA